MSEATSVIYLASRDTAHDDHVIWESGGWPNDALVWARWCTEARLTRARQTNLPLEDALSGQLFWQHGELRWRRLHNTTRYVYVGEDPPPPEWFPGCVDRVMAEVSGLDNALLAHEHVFEREALPSYDADEGVFLLVQRLRYHTTELGELDRNVALVSERAINLRSTSQAGKDGDHAPGR